MHPQRNDRHRETPTKRRNPSGDVRWVARYTNRDGQRKKAGTFKLKGPCRMPVEGYWSGSTWAGCCAQHAIDAAYERESMPQPMRTDTLGGYAELWPQVHPRAKRTNDENAWRIGVVLAMEIEGLALRDFPMNGIRRRHTLAVQAELLKQGRTAEGAANILRAMSAMTNDAIDDEFCETNYWLRLGVRLNDPRVQKPPRPKRIWTMEQMHAFAAAAGGVRDPDRDEPTELERWRAVYAEPMIRLMSDCGLRFGEVMAVERAGLRPGWLRVKTVAHEGRSCRARRRRTTSPRPSSGATSRYRRRPRRCCARCPRGSTRRSCSPRRPARSGASATGGVTCGRPHARRPGWIRGRRSSARRGSQSSPRLASIARTWGSTPGTASQRRTATTFSRSTAAPSRSGV